jgi:phage shock protein E
MTSQELSAKAHAMVQAGAVLLDVRTREEYARGHLDGSKNIPVQELAQRIAEVGAPSTSVVVHCHAGMRSKAAAQLLRNAGFQDVLDIGTMSAW